MKPSFLKFAIFAALAVWFWRNYAGATAGDTSPPTPANKPDLDDNEF